MGFDYEIVMATEDDRKAIMSVYKAQIGREYCAWNDEYPSDDTINFDLSRKALFVLKNNNCIKATISLEEDEAVDVLSCWNKSLEPVGELARLAVLPNEQNKGFGRIMLKYGMDELKKRGFNAVHMLVNKSNLKAIKCYEDFDFDIVGECHMYNQDFLCYEKKI